jgi:ribosomal protein S18 acetylase RimI-like enzyme
MTSSVAKTCFDAIRAKQSAVVAGYDPMVVENQGIYEKLLLQAVDSSSIEEESEADSKPKSKPRTRRQTPLVNAGYASRVLSISYAIQSFVSYHKLVSSSLQQEQSQYTRNTKGRIRIVLLGCGVDVIGLWARSLVQTDDNTMAITIIEIDKPEVCSIKRKMITDQGMVDNLVERNANESTTKNTAATRYYTGNIVLPSSSSSSSNDNCDYSSDNCNDGCYDYVLIPGDLNDTSALERTFLFDDNDGQEEVPTLVVSELVLSYLPPSGTDRLLRWCCDRLCRTSDSALVSLEALGSPGISVETSQTAIANAGGVISVEEGYQQDYCQKFHDKMERGRSSNRTENHIASLPSNGLFHPIGSSAEEISCRLREARFAGASSATSLGVISSLAAASASNSKRNNNNNDAKTLVCPDIFDEHAALILHLQSYVLACGFIAPQLQHCDNLLFRRLMSPWERRPNTGPDLALMRSGLPIMDSGGGIVYDEIEVSDEASVRSLFQSTYGKEYTEKYPAIRKMVKGVLNNDMRETPITTQSNAVIDDSQGPQNISCGSSSVIGDFYRSSGGIFLVAAKYTMQSLPEDKIGQNGNHLIQSKIRQVVGCVGIRSYMGKDADSSRTLEIFRLAVDTGHRGQGIGRNLLRAVEAYARERRIKQDRMSPKFVANTLTILEDATNLYEKCGYRTERETLLGTKLLLRTYAKEADVDHQ